MQNRDDMVRLVREYTSFVTGNINVNQAENYTFRGGPTITLYGGHGRSLGLKTCGVANRTPICPVIVDNSPGEKATIVDGIEVEPQSSPACRPWKLRYIDGDVLAPFLANI